MTGRAVLSPDGVYRYTLERTWQPELGPTAGGDDPRCLFVMLNPSTADELRDDQTIRRCVGFARSWGFTTLAVVNLFALRSTDPGALERYRGDPVGPDNDAWIASEVERASLVVAAWGTHGVLFDRGRAVLERIGRPVYCLGVTRSGQPRHPLRLDGAIVPELLERA